MSPLGLAWRGLIRQPARAALGVAGIMAVGALLLDMLLLSRGLLLSFGELLRSTGFDVRVTATADPFFTSPSIADAASVVEALRRLPEVREAVAVRLGTAEASSDARRAGHVDLVGSGARDRTWTVLEGEGLLDETAAPPPVLVNRNLASHLRLVPGSSLRLRGTSRGISALPEVEFRVAGIISNPFDSPGALTAITTLPGLRRACGEPNDDRANVILVASRPEAGATATAAAIRHLRPDLNAFSNEQSLDRFARTDFSYFRQISFVLSTITLFFAFLLVATLLTVSVNQRLGELAALRALGVRRARVVATLFCESLLLVGAGAALSLPAGALLASRLDAILRGIPGLPERLHFFVFEARSVGLHLALLASSGLLAALYPAYLAFRLPIAATLRKEVVS